MEEKEEKVIDKRGFNLIKNQRVAYWLAIVLITIALLISINEFIFLCYQDGFLYENLFAFVFEFVTNGMLLYSLIRKKSVLIEIALVVLKVFEATYYPLRSCQRLDMLILIEGMPQFYVVSHTLFAVGAFALLIGLIFYCLFKLRGRRLYWDIMKLWVLLSAVFMFVMSIIYIVEVFRNSEMMWEEMLEPVTLCVLFVGMFMTYEYVEEIEAIYE